MSWRSRANLDWLARLAGVQPDHPLASHTSFNLGGRADFFVEVNSRESLLALISECHHRAIPRLLLGAGTNLLIADAGIEGLVVRCATRAHRIEGERVCAEAGLKMMRLARICAAAGLSGFEWAIGIPGTVGGAVHQNAGCFGLEMSQVLLSAEGLIPGRDVQRWPAAELELGYRSSALQRGALVGAVITSATLHLRPGDPALAKKTMAEHRAQRERSQPLAGKSCGSVFKNPPTDSAGRLIEAAGMKGAREGGAQVSEQHANFILNSGGARAEEVDRLIDRVRRAVRDTSGVELELEVEKVGRWR